MTLYDPYEGAIIQSTHKTLLILISMNTEKRRECERLAPASRDVVSVFYAFSQESAIVILPICPAAHFIKQIGI